jgi:hypothetical protein
LKKPGASAGAPVDAFRTQKLMAKKNDIPRRIAGVKVPKALRKSVVLNSLLANEVGRQVLGEALVAGAAAAAKILADADRVGMSETGSAVRTNAKQTGKIAADTMTSAMGTMAEVISDAGAPTFVRRHRSRHWKPR